jgi:hypothetical protein
MWVPISTWRKYKITDKEEAGHNRRSGGILHAITSISIFIGMNQVWRRTG